MKNEVVKLYEEIKESIIRRISEFEALWKYGNDEEIFSEVAFCLLTPQSKAKVCWHAIERLTETGLLFTGSQADIQKELYGVRFKQKKALYIVSARNFFSNGKLRIKKLISSFKEPFKARDWLVKNIKGFGYKEASHFLRNIGKGRELSILDRHILKNLLCEGVIEEIPTTLTKRRYAEIEDKMRKYAKEIGIPLQHLDFVFWYRETGEIFK